MASSCSNWARGFAFVGQQVRLELAGEEFYCDLLFYHLELRCYWV
ncbi:PDDEXK nuclease domain-containing protein [Kribbella alba]